jgi:hypothetical protein
VVLVHKPWSLTSSRNVWFVALRESSSIDAASAKNTPRRHILFDHFPTPKTIAAEKSVQLGNEEHPLCHLRPFFEQHSQADCSLQDDLPVTWVKFHNVSATTKT